MSLVFNPYFRRILGILEAPRSLPLTKQPGTSFIFLDSGRIGLDKLQNHEFPSKNTEFVWGDPVHPIFVRLSGETLFISSL